MRKHIIIFLTSQSLLRNLKLGLNAPEVWGKMRKSRPYAAIFRAFSAFRTESQCSFRRL